MEYKLLGKSDLKVSRIGFGCMSLKTDQKDTAAIIHAAIEQGINYFDTADLYDKGLNETALGAALKGKRDKVIVATKVGNQWRADGSGWDWNPRRDHILEAVEQSLRRLQTDCIDFYQLHGGTIEDPIDETIEAFTALQQQGKIRFYGISSIRPNVIRAYVERSNIAGVMMQYSLLDRRPEESILDLLQQNGIGVLARGTVASGLLVNKPPKNYLDRSTEQVAQGAQAIRQVAAGKDPAQVAIQFALAREAITAAVVGIRTMEQLKVAVEAGSQSVPLPAIEQLRSNVPVNTYAEHR
ncbi:aldo/keto reductase [Segetibacter sp. 3557_3]|uniref:aldo/keto reductase n=1 Tax=Segetibacter sp. 3557_3 TaxID=2547429 RepID=UPI0010586B3E|nr:aldo/keto reductase [Segetibacter sp. 3557_3]TDH18365.1 aldo/keto reductase [Segetibacter sp. 3557_3]